MCNLGCVARTCQGACLRNSLLIAMAKTATDRPIAGWFELPRAAFRTCSSARPCPAFPAGHRHLADELTQLVLGLTRKSAMSIKHAYGSIPVRAASRANQGDLSHRVELPMRALIDMPPSACRSSTRSVAEPVHSRIRISAAACEHVQARETCLKNGRTTCVQGRHADRKTTLDSTARRQKFRRTEEVSACRTIRNVASPVSSGSAPAGGRRCPISDQEGRIRVAVQVATSSSSLLHRRATRCRPLRQRESVFSNRRRQLWPALEIFMTNICSNHPGSTSPGARCDYRSSTICLPRRDQEHNLDRRGNRCSDRPGHLLRSA